MTDRTRIGINGFGRMGRLALRAAWGSPELDFCHINELPAARTPPHTCSCSTPYMGAGRMMRVARRKV